jgi:hypothetical protein
MKIHGAGKIIWDLLAHIPNNVGTLVRAYVNCSDFFDSEHAEKGVVTNLNQGCGAP